MSSHVRRVVLWVSAPVIAFAVVGGFIGKVTAREDTYPHLRVFYDVVNLITDRYVEKTDTDKVMNGAVSYETLKAAIAKARAKTS